MPKETEQMILLAEKKAKQRINAARIQAEEMLRGAQTEAERLISTANEKSRADAKNALLREDEYEKEEGVKQRVLLQKELERQKAAAQKRQGLAVERAIAFLQAERIRGEDEK